MKLSFCHVNYYFCCQINHCDKQHYCHCKTTDKRTYDIKSSYFQTIDLFDIKTLELERESTITLKNKTKTINKMDSSFINKIAIKGILKIWYNLYIIIYWYLYINKLIRYE